MMKKGQFLPNTKSTALMSSPKMDKRDDIEFDSRIKGENEPSLGKK